MAWRRPEHPKPAGHRQESCQRVCGSFASRSRWNRNKKWQLGLLLKKLGRNHHVVCVCDFGGVELWGGLCMLKNKTWCNISFWFNPKLFVVKLFPPCPNSFFVCLFVSREDFFLKFILFVFFLYSRFLLESGGQVVVGWTGRLGLTCIH